MPLLGFWKSDHFFKGTYIFYIGNKKAGNFTATTDFDHIPENRID